MNSYEAKQTARKARFEKYASEAAAESVSTYQRARSMCELIPFGQPILIGHHSEQRDRNFRDRIHNTYRKAFDLQDKANHYADKAASVGTGGISSDDPDAIEKLRAELANIEASQERMKEANKIIRSKKTEEEKIVALMATGFTADQVAEVIKPDLVGYVGFAPYALSNNNANAHRIKARIDELEKRSKRKSREKEGNGYTYREDAEENRVMFLFLGKPAEATRSLLKSNGFKWSPSRGAWVRQWNNAGLWAAKSILKVLDKAEAAA
ncbi:DUF3560 domain-containing protein [Xylella fastidiosa]|uniref:DUF3560 domain-containing protein n=1 Tax=Xylella fastidiosa TaxID=2371 RepID=UPI000FFF5E70|nr:DUF3560 domain-containing protein [Xylella fastidiosa]RWA36905.1 conjugal transfer protein TraC [Xylella fastidiosa subsp. multiplex]